jgi:hypothetical protein
MPRPKLFDVEIKTALPNKTHEELQRLAERDNATVSDLVRGAIGNYLKNRRKKDGQT